MNEVKWIKLSVGMPDNRKIKRIRRLPDGNNIILIWVFLLLKAAESNKRGGLFFLEDMPYTHEDLADEFDFSIDLIEFALVTLEKLNMIETYDEVIYIKNWEKYQSADKLERIREQTRKRVARHREKQKQIDGIKVCSYCGEEATGEDHIVPTSKGGSDGLHNRVPCCIRCNRIKNNHPLVNFLNNNRSIVRDDLISSNSKLSNYVELCNVTNRYKVTQSNATDIELDKDIDIDKEQIPYAEIVKHLNEKAGKRFKHTANKTRDLIKARWNEGNRLEDFKKVIDVCCKKWSGQVFSNGQNGDEYLRPSTLFNGKFDERLNWSVEKEKPTNSKKSPEQLQHEKELKEMQERIKANELSRE